MHTGIYCIYWYKNTLTQPISCRHGKYLLEITFERKLGIKRQYHRPLCVNISIFPLSFSLFSLTCCVFYCTCKCSVTDLSVTLLKEGKNPYIERSLPLPFMFLSYSLSLLSCWIMLCMAACTVDSWTRGLASPCLSPVAVLGLLGHTSEWWLQAAQVVVQLASITQHQQMLVLVLLTDATAAGKHVKLCVRKGWLLVVWVMILKSKIAGT